MIVLFNNGSQLLSYSVSDKGTFRAVRGQLKTLSQNGSVGSEISQRDDEAKLLKVTKLLKT